MEIGRTGSGAGSRTTKVGRGTIEKTLDGNILQYVQYELLILQAYAKKDDSESWAQVRELAETVLQNPEWDRLHQLNENEIEVRSLLAEAYVFEGNTNRAVEEYKKLLKQVNDEENVEYVLEKLQLLSEEPSEESP